MSGFDATEEGANMRAIVKEYTGFKCGRYLKIEMVPKPVEMDEDSSPILSDPEEIRE
ncbi:MAG: hypothetical protein O3B01_10795 [Planctomycetota bacterium]|nr:hypothetical protein [Planctomycetota bacterium]MDA1139058.1 hypothetical protein [Planctomycetota bacterium]